MTVVTTVEEAELEIGATVALPARLEPMRGVPVAEVTGAALLETGASVTAAVEVVVVQVVLLLEPETGASVAAAELVELMLLLELASVGSAMMEPDW